MDRVWLVTFIPENITVEVAEGTNLLMAAKKAGIDMESPCGGRGTCGKCAVRVVSGAFEMSSDTHLTEELRQHGYVLACKIKVQDNMEVEVPKFSRLTRHKVLLESKGALDAGSSSYFSKVSINPLCKKLHVKLDPPDLSDMANDFDRVKAYLQREYGLNDIGISLNCLKRLPEGLRKGGWEAALTVVEVNGKAEIIDIKSGKCPKPAYGVAIDIGTTTIAINLVDVGSGKTIDSAGTYNQQSIYGSDVISRIIYTDEFAYGLEVLQNAVIKTINSLINELLNRQGLSRNDIAVAVCAGNTVMSHMFLGITPTYLRLEPYIPAAVKFPGVRAMELGLDINPDSVVYTLPCVASYVGGDITSGVLATMISRSEKLILFIDIGTNGEMVLGNSEWMVTCACSAGPAFEGSGISCGMRAMDGAIDRVEVDAVTLESKYRTIGGIKPIGICGSGLIQALSEMKEAGVIDRAGKVLENWDFHQVRRGNEGMEYILVPAENSGSEQEITVTEGDVKNLLRAKGAIFAGIRTMLQMVQLDINDIDKVYIAGGFGNYINITDAINIGLLPDLPVEKYEYVGNSSLQGAMTVLLCKEALVEIEKIADQMTYLELSVGNQFMDEFISALFIPHTDLGLFPSVGK